MKRLLFFILTLCFCFAVRAEYNVTSVIYDGNGQQCNWWLNNDNEPSESLSEKYMPYPLEEDAPEVSRYLEMTRVQNDGWDWHGICFDLSGLNTTIGAGNQIALWVKKDIAENVQVEFKFKDGTNVNSGFVWVDPSEGWKYIVFNLWELGDEYQEMEIQEMYVKTHTGGSDGQVATVQVTGIVKGFDLAQSNIPEHLYLLGSATGNNRLKMTETQDGIYIWCGELSAGGLRFVQSSTSDYPSFVATYGVSFSPGQVATKAPLDRVTEGNFDYSLDFAAGKYVIVLNTNTDSKALCGTYNESNPNQGAEPTMSVTVAPYDQDLYLIGNATPAKWDYQNAAKMTKAEDGLYTYTGSFSEGDLKILATNTNFEPSYVSAMSWTNVRLNVGEANKIVYHRTWCDQDYSVPQEHSFYVPEAGIYRLSVNLRSSYPVLIAETVPEINVYTEGNLIYIENVEGNYTVTGSTGENHAGQETAGGLVEISTQCNGVYEVQANGQSKRVLVY